MATFVNTPWDAEMSLSVHPVGAASAWFQWVAQNQPHNNEPDRVRREERRRVCANSENRTRHLHTACSLEASGPSAFSVSTRK